MEEYYGVVKEVYIPNEDKIDVMLSNMIGYKILLDNNEELIIEENQYDINCDICKEDKVIIRKQIIDTKVFYDIELEDGEYYE